MSQIDNIHAPATAYASLLQGAPRIVVAGAGLGGLSAAIHLATKGLHVTLIEKSKNPGGKARAVSSPCGPIDAGPTVLTMRWVFDELFDHAGAKLEQFITIAPAIVLARHWWSEHEQLDLLADMDATATQIAQFAGSDAASGYQQFCRDSARAYHALKPSFITTERPSTMSLIARMGPAGALSLLRASPFTSLWKALTRYFRDPRLLQLFGRYATYCGSSPFLAPSVLMVIAHVEREGVWQVKGGINQLIAAMEQLARRVGVQFVYGCELKGIDLRPEGVRGVRVQYDSANVDHIAATHLVFNGDTQALQALVDASTQPELRSNVSQQQRSLSAITWCVQSARLPFALSHHNVFFSSDYAGEFRQLFSNKEVPISPTVYLHAQDRYDSSEPTDTMQTPENERLMCLINAPADGDVHTYTDKELQRCEESIHRLLSHCGLKVQILSASSTRTTPTDFHKLFPATCGALYGPATHGWRASFQRPGSRTRWPGIYLAGGAVHPGAGMPMAAISGELAAASLMQDLTSRSMFRTVATPGGT